MRSIEKWEEISEVSFAEDENKNSIAVYMSLWGLWAEWCGVAGRASRRSRPTRCACG